MEGISQKQNITQQNVLKQTKEYESGKLKQDIKFNKYSIVF